MLAAGPGGSRDLVFEKDMERVKKRQAASEHLANTTFRTASAIQAALRKKLRLNFEAVQRAFRMLDEDKSGEVDKKEFRHVLSMFNLECRDDHFEQLFNMFDKDRSGTIEYHEFMKEVGGDITANFELDPEKMGLLEKALIARKDHTLEKGKEEIERRADATRAAIRSTLTAEAVDAALRRKMMLSYGAFERRFRAMDSRGRGRLSVKQFQQLLDGFELRPDKHQFTRLLRFYDRSQSGVGRGGGKKSERRRERQRRQRREENGFGGLEIDYEHLFLHAAASPHHVDLGGGSGQADTGSGAAAPRGAAGGVADIGGKVDIVKEAQMDAVRARALRAEHAARKGYSADAAHRALRERMRRAPDQLRALCRRLDPATRRVVATGTGSGFADTHRPEGGAPTLDRQGFAALLRALQIPVSPDVTEGAASAGAGAGSGTGSAFEELVRRYESVPGSGEVDYNKHILAEDGAEDLSASDAEGEVLPNGYKKPPPGTFGGVMDLVKEKQMRKVRALTQQQQVALTGLTTAEEADAQLKMKLLVQTPQFAAACKARDKQRNGFIGRSAFRDVLKHTFQIEPSAGEFDNMLRMPHYAASPSRRGAAGAAGRDDGAIDYRYLIRRFGDNPISELVSLPIRGTTPSVNHLSPVSKLQMSPVRVKSGSPALSGASGGVHPIYSARSSLSSRSGSQHAGQMSPSRSLSRVGARHIRA